MFLHDPLTDALLRGALLTPVALLWVLVLARVVGLRSFSKMTAFDFVATVAAGSLLANAAGSTEWTGFAQKLAALVGLFAVQFVLATLRQRSDVFRRWIDNRPRLLAREGVVDAGALRSSRVARADVVAKLREANAARWEDVRAVVLEATGDISVIHGEETVDRELLEDLR